MRKLFSGTTSINVTSTSSGTVTSVITTGPDGTSLDEGSQQSTLSNASAGQYFKKLIIRKFSLKELLYWNKCQVLQSPYSIKYKPL